MYIKSARFYDQLYQFKNYEAACRDLHLLVQARMPGARTMLDVGCGTGRHVEHLRQHYAIQGLDLNEELLAIARTRCPEVPFHQGDMASFDLGARFDVVACLFSAIAYVKTVDRLNAAIAAFGRHLEPGGLLLIEPWISPEQYWERNIVLNVTESPDQKIAWMYVGKRVGNVVTNDIHYVVGTPEGVFPIQERHEMGLFRETDYRSAIGAAGLRMLFFDSRGFFGNGLYVITRDGSGQG